MSALRSRKSTGETKTRGDAVERKGKEEKGEALRRAVERITKQFGSEAIRRLGSKACSPVEVIPTGSISLDHALGVGGLPRGRVVELYGPEGSGKTTLALSVVAQAQAAGGTAAFIDAEHALDPAYARAIGVDIENLLLAQPSSGEEALRITEELITSGAVDIVAIDSVAALVPRAELDGEIGDTHVGLQARLMSQALRKIVGVVHRSQTLVLFVNQIREKIGVMFGSPETTPGGRALKFYSSVRLDIRRIGKITEREAVIGNATRVKVVKNKVAPPFRQCEFEIIFGRGISRAGELLDLAVGQKLAEKAGAWYSLGQTRLGQGRSQAVAFLEAAENADLAGALEAKLARALYPERFAEEEEQEGQKGEKKDAKSEKKEVAA